MGFFYIPIDTKDYIKLLVHKNKIKKIYRRIESIIGYVINVSLELEWHLNNIIRTYYVKDSVKDSRHIKFWKDILDFLTFDRKIKIISEIGIHKKRIFKSKYRDFIKRLNNIRIIRNKIVHNSFMIKQNMHIYIDRGIGKKNRYEIINKKFKQDFKKEALELMSICSEFQEYIRKNDSRKRK